MRKIAYSDADAEEEIVNLSSSYDKSAKHSRVIMFCPICHKMGIDAVICEERGN